jgi:hypothetical protein
MKIDLAVALVLASSTFVAGAAADSACVPPLVCGPVIDAGACSPQADPGSPCAGDAGRCQHLDRLCGGDSTTPVCLGPAPPEPPCGGNGGCNCKIGVDPRGAVKRAAVPLFLLVAGASALLLDRRQRNRSKSMIVRAKDGQSR